LHRWQERLQLVQRWHRLRRLWKQRHPLHQMQQQPRCKSMWIQGQLRHWTRKLHWLTIHWSARLRYQMRDYPKTLLHQSNLMPRQIYSQATSNGQWTKTNYIPTQTPTALKPTTRELNVKLMKQDSATIFDDYDTRWATDLKGSTQTKCECRLCRSTAGTI
jgi:hypothetical protein